MNLQTSWPFCGRAEKIFSRKSFFFQPTENFSAPQKKKKIARRMSMSESETEAQSVYDEEGRIKIKATCSTPPPLSGRPGGGAMVLGAGEESAPLPVHTSSFVTNFVHKAPIFMRYSSGASSVATTSELSNDRGIECPHESFFLERFGVLPARPGSLKRKNDDAGQDTAAASFSSTSQEQNLPTKRRGGGANHTCENMQGRANAEFKCALPACSFANSQRKNLTQHLKAEIHTKRALGLVEGVTGASLPPIKFCEDDSHIAMVETALYWTNNGERRRVLFSVCETCSKVRIANDQHDHLRNCVLEMINPKKGGPVTHVSAKGDQAIAFEFLDEAFNWPGVCFMLPDKSGGLRAVSTINHSQAVDAFVAVVAREERRFPLVTHTDDSINYRLGDTHAAVVQSGCFDLFVSVDKMYADTTSQLLQRLRRGELLLYAGAGAGAGWLAAHELASVNADQLFPIDLRGMTLVKARLFDRDNTATVMVASGADASDFARGTMDFHPPLPPIANNALLFEVLVVAPFFIQSLQRTCEHVAERRRAQSARFTGIMPLPCRDDDDNGDDQDEDDDDDDDQDDDDDDDDRDYDGDGKKKVVAVRTDPNGNDTICDAFDRAARAWAAKRDLRSAFDLDSVEMVQCLLRKQEFDPSIDDNAAIRWAAERGHLELVTALLRDIRVDPSARKNDAIQLAAQNGHVAVVECLLKDSRVQPEDNVNQAIRSASANGHIGVVDLLLQKTKYLRRFRYKNVEPQARTNEAIQVAAANGHAEVVERLMQDARVDPSANSNGAIRVAASNGHLPVVKLLVQDERVAADGYVALRIATYQGHHDVVDFLRTCGLVYLGQREKLKFIEQPDWSESD